MAPLQKVLSLADFESEHGDMFEIPEGYGLSLRLNQSDGTLLVEAVPDYHFTEIHPNCYAPASLQDVRLLHGGGSGTAVFHGASAKLGSLVMKHANAKDTREIFSLAKTQRELLHREVISKTASHDMRDRIPCFVMLYISPYHLRNRAHELWTSLRGSFWAHGADVFKSEAMLMTRRSVDALTPRTKDSANTSGRRNMKICKTDQASIDLNVGLHDAILETPHEIWQGPSTIADGISFLASIEDPLVALQEEEHWKVTLAQQTIGGDSPKNGAGLLLEGNLTGENLMGLIREFVTVMKDLDHITKPGERNVIDIVKDELQEYRDYRNVNHVSKAANLVVGSAITKNFTPKTGRFPKLRAFGDRFRERSMTLVQQEFLPAEYLGKILLRGANLSNIFHDFASKHNAFDCFEDMWLNVLEHAVSFPKGSASNCIWTCGLTDAGLHNTFYCPERGLELFDLGPAKAMPQPAFLTKFLMSFYHTAGMEDNRQGSWVVRFTVKNHKLEPTADTKRLLPYLDGAFQTVLNRLMRELFDDDMGVRSLLIKYVILQLLSDASFCLERWEQKGGGHKRTSEKSKHLSKWLWRSIWDVFVASHVFSQYSDCVGEMKP